MIGSIESVLRLVSAAAPRTGRRGGARSRPTSPIADYRRRPAGEPWPNVMPQALNFRLAVGVFDGIGDLSAPISELLRSGVGLDHLGIMASEPTLSCARCPAHLLSEDWARVAHLMARAQPIAGWHGPPQVLAGRDIPGLADATVWLSPPRDRSPYRADRPTCSVEDLLRRGHTALAVHSRSDEEQRRSVGVLLRTSRFPVEAHAFASRT